MAMNAGGFLIAVQELKELISDNGRIVLISGNTTLRYATPTTEVLGVAKASMESMVRTLAFSLGPRGITVNGLGLGLYDTESSRYALGLDNSYQQRVEITCQRSALKRMGKAADVAGVAGFLCTPEAGYVTGQMIMVDGGISIASPQ